MQAASCLGLIGGLGVGAAVYYFEQLAKAHLTRGVPMRLMIAHADMRRAVQHVRRGETAQLGGVFRRTDRASGSGRRDVRVIPAVTPHICMPELRGRSPLPLISIVEETARAIRSRRLRRVTLFGTRYTVETTCSECWMVWRS